MDVPTLRVAKKRAYHHGDLRGALVNAAFLIAMKEGPEALTLRAVARRAGVSEAAPYHHFADKRALLAAAAGVGFERLDARMVTTLEGRRTPLTRVVAFAEAYVAFAVDEPGAFRLLFGAHVAEQDLASIPEAAIPGRRLKQRVRTIAREAIDPAKIDPEAFFEMLWASSLGWALLVIEKELDPRGVGAPDVQQKVELAGKAARCLVQSFV